MSFLFVMGVVCFVFGAAAYTVACAETARDAEAHRVALVEAEDAKALAKAEAEAAREKTRAEREIERATARAERLKEEAEKAAVWAAARGLRRGEARPDSAKAEVPANMEEEIVHEPHDPSA